ncbi:MAG: iron ABC transporter permease [Bacteroidales bacterium]|nr:iron ABC transporter permease [Bacteroidales bacterium]
MQEKTKLYSTESRSWILFILAFFTLLFFCLDVLLGSVQIPFKAILQIIGGKELSHPEWRVIIFDFRVPRAITAIIAGIALSVSGLQMQTIFRNPLAGPYVLGISSGASLGVALLIMGFSAFGISGFGHFGNWALVFAATFGAGLILLLILSISVRINDIMTILILGILFGSIATALVAILQYFSSETMLKSFIVWTMGSLGNVSHDQLGILALVVSIGILICLASVKVLNTMLLGEEYAHSLGVNAKVARTVVFISTSILAGAVTAFCGPIGFIGIVVPHISRLLFKTADHKVLIPGSMLIGAIFILISDIISKLPGYDQVLPINSVTALLGIPVIIWIIFKRKKITSLA